MIVDAHLDLAYNASRGRDPRMPASQQPIVENEIATVGLPDLRAGGVNLICATIFCEPASSSNPRGYTNAEQARTQAISQLNWYRSCVDQKLMRLVRNRNELTGDGLGAILLLEGADAIRSPEDLQEWHDNGLRILGLAWKRTRFAGGTGAPGPLTPEGRTLAKEIDRFGIIHDTSHLAEQSFWDLFDLTGRPVIASHSNCRSIVAGDRHLSDEMIRAIASRGGVIGINFYDKFLIPKTAQGTRRAMLSDVVDHIKHMCDLLGSVKHVGLGTDMDGGLGREQIPSEIQTSADLRRAAEALTKHFSDTDTLAIMGSNWRRFFEQHLPA